MIPISVHRSRCQCPVSNKDVKIIVSDSSQYQSKINMYWKQLPEVEQNRASKFENELDKHTFIASHFWVRQALAFHLNLPFNKVKIHSEYIKKPYLVDYNIDFNLSHTRGFFAIIIANKPNLAVGIDIENQDRKVDINSIIEGYMHKQEQAYILNKKTNSNIMIRFLEIWTKKEALLKMLGIGIDTQLSEYNLTEGYRELKMDATKKIPSGIIETNIHTYIEQKVVLSYSVANIIKKNQ